MYISVGMEIGLALAGWAVRSFYAGKVSAHRNSPHEEKYTSNLPDFHWAERLIGW